MNSIVKGRIEMASRVLAYSREHPSEAAGYQAAVARLVEQLALAQAMAGRQATQGLLGKGAIAERQEVRRAVAADLQLLAAMARVAGGESVEMPVVIRYPGPKSSNLHFLEGARAALGLAREHEALLLRSGLPEGHLAQLATGIDSFAALLGRGQEAVVARIDARSELEQLGRGLSRLADQIGAMTRHRYRTDPAALVAWRFARSTGRRHQKPVPVPAEATLPALPPATTKPEASS